MWTAWVESGAMRILGKGPGYVFVWTEVEKLSVVKKQVFEPLFFSL